LIVWTEQAQELFDHTFYTRYFPFNIGEQYTAVETWSLALRKERRLRVFENRVLRRIFGPKRDEVTRIGENYVMRS
jgi:hypothetical protein